MRKIINWIRDYIKEELHWGYFLTVFALCLVFVFAEYQYHVARDYFEGYYRNWQGLPRYFFLFALPYIGSFLLYSAFYKRWELWKNKGFLFLVFLIPIVYAMRCHFHYHREWIREWFERDTYLFVRQISNQWVCAILVFIPMGIYWYIEDRKNMPFYGLKLKEVDLKPYFGMLLLMLIPIAWASTQADFLRYYPTCSRIPGWEGADGWWKVLVYELSYGVDFVATEAFFRGFLLLAMAKYVGRGAILPMAAFYMISHFGKPFGETFSSFWGGMLLGIVAYESKSIAGGVIAHLGIAWMMEMGGLIGRKFFMGAY